MANNAPQLFNFKFGLPTSNDGVDTFNFGSPTAKDALEIFNFGSPAGKGSVEAFNFGSPGAHEAVAFSSLGPPVAKDAAANFDFGSPLAKDTGDKFDFGTPIGKNGAETFNFGSPIAEDAVDSFTTESPCPFVALPLPGNSSVVPNVEGKFEGMANTKQTTDDLFNFKNSLANFADVPSTPEKQLEESEIEVFNFGTSSQLLGSSAPPSPLPPGEDEEMFDFDAPLLDTLIPESQDQFLYGRRSRSGGVGDVHFKASETTASQLNASVSEVSLTPNSQDIVASVEETGLRSAAADEAEENFNFGTSMGVVTATGTDTGTDVCLVVSPRPMGYDNFWEGNDTTDEPPVFGYDSTPSLSEVELDRVKSFSNVHPPVDFGISAQALGNAHEDVLSMFDGHPTPEEYAQMAGDLSTIRRGQLLLEMHHLNTLRRCQAQKNRAAYRLRQALDAELALYLP